MSTVHVIRLRGPWECQALEPGGTQAAAERVTGPGAWPDGLGPDFQGSLRYTRRFSCPTNLGPGERVWLVCQAAGGQGEVYLNDQRVLAYRDGQPLRHDVTELLGPSNVVRVEMSSRPAGGEPTLEVRLEIESLS